MKRTRWDRLQGQYHLIRDCLDGEDAMKDQGQLYVPKPDGMSPTNYTHDLDRGCFYGAPEMTLRALCGLALRKDPVVSLPPHLEPMRLNATHESAPLSILIEDMVREVMSMGRFGILLDFPGEGATVNTVPHISTLKAESIEDYQTAFVDGRKVLKRLSEIEIITDGGRRRRWSASEEMRIVEETLEEGASISVVARRNGVAPNLLYRWRRLMLDGGAVAVSEDDDVTSNRAVRQMEERIRELERQLGRKTLEVEILKEAQDTTRSRKTDVARSVAAEGRFPVKVVAETLGVSRSNLNARLNGSATPRRRYHKAQDAAVASRAHRSSNHDRPSVR